MKHYYQNLTERMRTPIDFVKWTMPLHFGGVYAYLSNSVTVGAIIIAAFYLAYSIQENK